MFTLFSLPLHLPDPNVKQTGGGALADPVIFHIHIYLFVFNVDKCCPVMTVHGVNEGQVFRKINVHQLCIQNAVDDAGGKAVNILIQTGKR